VLTPHARWRPALVAYRCTEFSRASDLDTISVKAVAGGRGADLPRYWTWTALKRRAFELHVLRVRSVPGECA
jgi:hypothetical protein